MPTLPGLVHRGDAAVRHLLSHAAHRRGWTPAVLAHPGYGSGGRVRVLGRVLLAPPGTHPEDRRAVPGWQRFLTLESPHAPVTVEVILLAIGLAVLGGLLAGALGGWRASRLRPAEALRSVA